MDLSTLFQSLMGKQPEAGPVQAYTRTTHTPVTWDSLPSAFGQYRPSTGQIVVDKDKLPQTNPDPTYMSNVLRHEQVHALMPPASVQTLQGYFHDNPDKAQSGNEALSNFGYDTNKLAQVVLGSNKTLAQEAPAYAVQGYQFGMGDLIKQYLSALPPALRGKYMTLLGKYAPTEGK
jgi:hypothetical protein